MDSDIKSLIDFLQLEPHPEGGYFRETYRSDETFPAEMLSDRYHGPRCLGTAILYLVTRDSCSLMHRLITDEIFHFYSGDPVSVVRLHTDGSGDITTLGSDIIHGQMAQCVVTRGCWQGLRLLSGGRYALLGTTMSPAFEFEDFELGTRKELILRYPSFKDEIMLLTRE